MPKSFFVYILKCSDNSYYTGHTDDLEKRLLEHQNIIENCYTAIRQPTKLVFYRCMHSRMEALAFEYQVKRWSRKKKEALITKNWENLSVHAKKQFD